MQKLVTILQFNRKISMALTSVLFRMGFSPNTVTMLALVCGLLCGLSMSKGTHGFMILGACWLHLSFLLDNSDGELARLKGQETRFGKRFDVIADFVVDQALWIGLFFGAIAQGVKGPVAIVGTAACIGSFINFLLVVQERRAGCSTSMHIKHPHDLPKKKGVFLSFLDLLSHNGDSITFVWIMSLIGYPGIFLLAGAVFINALWLTRLVVHFKHFSRRSPAFSASLKVLLKVVALLLGVYFLFLSAQYISWADLVTLFKRGGLGFLYVMAVFPVTSFFHARGLFSLLLPETRRRVRFVDMFLVFVFGDAVNKVTPFIDVAGEPVKMLLFYKKAHAPLDESIVSVCIARIVFVITEILFILIGVVSLMIYQPSSEFMGIGILGMIFSAVLVVILVSAQTKGLVQIVPALAQKLKMHSFDSPESQAVWANADQSMRLFYQARRGDFIRSVIWNLVGWVVSSFEVYVVFWVFGVPMNFVEAMIAQSLLQAITTVSFFIPGNFGAQEGGLSFLLSHLGFSATEGFALSLMKRFRQFFWVIVGPLLYLGHFKFFAKKV